MAKTFNKEKHFDLNFFRAKGMAYFDTLDFSDISNEEIREIATCDIPDIEFYGCTFKDLDLSHTEFKSNISFTQCKFKGNTNFEECAFRKNGSFAHSVFNGVANFNYVTYDQELSFYCITAKPAKGGRFLFLGEGKRSDKRFIDHYITFENAVFESEACFTGSSFLGMTIFKKTFFCNKFWFTNVDFGYKLNFNAKFDCTGFQDISMCFRILKAALLCEHYTCESRVIERLEEKIRERQLKLNDIEQGEPVRRVGSILLTTEEAAAYLKLKPNTLERWRSQYPHRLPFVKIGRTVKYRKDDLQAFISGNRRGS